MVSLAWVRLGAAGLLSVGLLLAAAKSHGRQLRLERELEGYRDVSFGRDARNPSWVEALWRADRVRFWTLYPLAATGGGGYLLAAAWLPGPRPTFGGGGAFPAWPAAALAVLFWAPAFALAANGLLSLRRLLRALRARRFRSPAARDSLQLHGRWRRAARAGSLAWWATTGAVGLGVALLGIV